MFQLIRNKALKGGAKLQKRHIQAAAGEWEAVEDLTKDVYTQI